MAHPGRSGDPTTGRLFLEFQDRPFGAPVATRKRVAVSSTDRAVAKRKADALAAAFAQELGPRPADVTLHELLDNYLRATAGEKGASKRGHDVRTARLLVECFGRDVKAQALTRQHWDRYIRARRSGTLAPRGGRKAPKPGEPRPLRPVGERVIAYDLTFLMTVLNWATVSGADGRDGVLLERNPLRGLPKPKNESPKRAVVTEAQYRDLLRVSDGVGAGFRLALVLAHETGHRIGSVRQLRWSDVDLEAGRVRWRAEHDKIGYEHTTPLTDEACRALRAAQTAQAAIAEAWLFPAPADPSQPCSRHLVRDWWERASRAAGLPTGERYGWHALRRKFASELKETDLRNLCHLGGWKSAQTVMTCYQRPDEERQRMALAARQHRRAGV